MSYYTQTALLERGWTLGAIRRYLGWPDTEGRSHLYHGGGSYLFAVARVDQVESSTAWKDWKSRRTVEPIAVDLLAATFTVNRAAKRFRDMAAAVYAKRFRRRGLGALARWASERKAELYGLKDRGIVAGVRSGRLDFCGLQAGLAVYRGEGFCFHSTLVPAGVVGVDSRRRRGFKGGGETEGARRGVVARRDFHLDPARSH